MTSFVVFTLTLLITISGGVLGCETAKDKQVFTTDRSAKALSHAWVGLDDGSLDQFTLGRSFFTIPWVEAPAATTARDGLGPLFNANSCASCHRNNGGGAASTRGGKALDRSIVIQLAQLSTHSFNAASKPERQPDPVYGHQLAINGTHRVPFEGQVEVAVETKAFTYPDGKQVTLLKPLIKVTQLNYGPLAKGTTLKPRRAPALVGMGLIEDIPAAQILQRQDVKDLNADGISGKANWVHSLEANKRKLGRFGWQATTTSVTEQTANALHNDMGLTNPMFPNPNCSAAQTACNSAYKSNELDVPMPRLQAISHYLKRLRVPRGQATTEPIGRQLFMNTGCQACHQVAYTTTKGIAVNPYSDFLLHDMGPALAEGDDHDQNTVSEWRTSPLWGLGLAKTLNPRAGYLHDGRAFTVEQAILWHGGEAQSARDHFIHLNKNQRDMLLSFLETL
ncbi:MAG: thiol oxidoreductase [Gammaproteobacteria bacterium]|nr:thiol oxidoreductase [Gammaproteobacteria bacterium]